MLLLVGSSNLAASVVCAQDFDDITTDKGGRSPAIHVLVTGDSSSTAFPNEGARLSIEADEVHVCDFFTSAVPAKRLDLIRLPLNRVTKDGILQAIDQLNVAPKDVVVFYYSGHGAFHPKEGHMLTPVNPNVEFLRRSTVRDHLLKKSPRLTVIVTDCCANVIEGNLPPQRLRAPEPPEKLSPLLEVLFAYSGIVDMMSSQPGESSWPRTAKSGGYFTYYFVNYLERNRDNWTTWQDIQRVVSKEVDEDTQKTIFNNPEVLKRQPELKGVRQTVIANDVGERGPRLGLRARKTANGLIARAVIEGSPADLAQLKAGDRILQINGEDVLTEDDYGKAVDKSGSVMQIRIQRGTAEHDVKVNLGDMAK